jgi:hypothetical protein
MLAVHILFVRDYGLQQDVSLQELNRWISASFREELDTRIIGLEEDWKNSRDCKLASDWDPPGFPPYEVKFVLGKKIEDGGFPRNRGISLSEPQHKLHYTPTSVWVESRQYYRVPAGGESWEKRIQSLSPVLHRTHPLVRRWRQGVGGFDPGARIVPQVR